jgi:glucose/arabinose dehydrogenase
MAPSATVSRALAYIPTMPGRRGATPLAIAAALAAAVAVAACSVDASPAPTSIATAPSATTVPTPSQRQTPGPTLAPTPAGSLAPLDLEHLSVELKPFAEIDGNPVDLVAPDDGSGRLFVVGREGRIWVVGANGKVAPGPMIDLSAHIVSGGEQGLLGLALHPGFPDDPRVYVNYTTGRQDVISGLALDSSDPNRLDPSSLQEVLAVDDPFANHNGGDLLFGPDGFLYAFLGDGGSGGDPLGSGQDRNSLLGKVLRLDIDHPAGDAVYSAPAGNPFANGGGRPEVWLYGLRNPWRASFDNETGDLWIGDVGQGAWEEVDVARAGVGGLNYGWNRMEGSHCYPPGSDCSTDGLTPPVSEYGHDKGCTVIGGYVYRGTKYPALAGAYLFADYCSGRIFALDPRTDGLRVPVQVGKAGEQISSFGEDAAGELYVTRLDGAILRVTATAR